MALTLLDNVKNKALQVGAAIQNNWNPIVNKVGNYLQNVPTVQAPTYNNPVANTVSKIISWPSVTASRAVKDMFVKPTGEFLSTASSPEGIRAVGQGVKQYPTQLKTLDVKGLWNNPATQFALAAPLFGGGTKSKIGEMTIEKAPLFIEDAYRTGKITLEEAMALKNEYSAVKETVPVAKTILEKMFKEGSLGKTIKNPIKIKGPSKLSPEELIRSNYNADQIAKDFNLPPVIPKKLSAMERSYQVNIAKDRAEIDQIIKEIQDIFKRNGIGSDVKPVINGLPKTEVGGLKKTLQEIEVGRSKTFDFIDRKTSEILARNGLQTNDLRAVMEGKISIDPQDAQVLRDIDNKILEISGGKVSLENHFPHISIDMQDKITINSSYGGRLASQLFDFNLFRENKIPEEKLINDVSALKQSYDTALSKKYGDALQAGEIIKANNIPVESEQANKVFEFVKKEGEHLDEINQEHLLKTPFGKSIDYIDDAKRSAEELSKITGNPIVRPIVPDTGNVLDPVIDKLRIDDTFFQQRTNPEIWKAFQDLRDSKLPDSPISHKVALAHFIETATSFDYESKSVKNLVNQFIDSELKSGKVIQSVGSKFLRLVSGIFSNAHIGGNVKTIITQPTELFRITVEEGPSTIKPAIQSLLADSQRIITRYGLNDVNAQLLAENPIWKEANTNFNLLDAAGKLNDKILNVTMAGMKFTEEMKNMMLAAMAEQKGLQKGLALDSIEMTRFVRDELFRVGHIGAKYSSPNIVKNNALASGLLQYSQYALKNFVLKYDTLRNVEDQARLYKVGAQVTADTLATLTVAAVTGVAVKDIWGLFQNSALPSGFGPLVTVPYEFATEAAKYYKDSNNPDINPEDVKPLSETWGNTLQRNFQPMGNQTLKTKGALDVLNKGYSESFKGNVNYPVGDLTAFQKAQAILFGVGAIPNKKAADKMWAAKEAGTSNVYPTLSSKQSTIFKTLPKDQQEAYYNKQIDKQGTSEQTIIRSLTNKKEGASLLDFFKKKDSVNPISNDQKIKEFYFPQGDASSTDMKIRNKAFKTIINTIEDNTLPDALKQKVIEQSGASQEDITYYELASRTTDERTQKFLDIANSGTHEELFTALAFNKRQVAGYSVTNTDSIDYLYDQGYLSKEEKKFLTNLKWDPVYNKFYMDRDYKTGGGQTATQRKAAINRLNALFKLGTGTTGTKKRKLVFTKLQTQQASSSTSPIPKLKLTGTKKSGQWFSA